MYTRQQKVNTITLVLVMCATSSLLLLGVSPTYSTATDFENQECNGSLSCGSSGGSLSCESGYTLYNNACYANQYCSTVDTNGSGKGGVVTTCATPPLPASCTAHGITWQSGNSQVFYSTSSVAYDKSCASYSAARMCNNGTVDGSDAYIFVDCTVAPSGSIADVSLIASPSIVRSGGSSTLTWDGKNADSCTLTGATVSTSKIAGEVIIEDIQGQRVYTLRCVSGGTVVSKSVTIKTLPRIQES